MLGRKKLAFLFALWEETTTHNPDARLSRIGDVAVDPIPPKINYRACILFSGNYVTSNYKWGDSVF
jgi:hypothetical protein